jgi:ADP-ribosylglycohydrolase
MNRWKRAGTVVGLVLTLSGVAGAGTSRLSSEALRDKIRGGWAGKVIGCTYGGPTEFRFQGTFIQDYQPIAWSGRAIPWSFKNAPGLYDDVYMNMTFVDVFRKEGLEAPARSLARAFADAPYPLWHANQMARANIKRGLEPPASGDWRNNPHADDIDFQIEADFAGLMSPGLVQAAAGFADRAGHIMNSGDGWYGGVYVAAMYSLAFVSNDVEYIAAEALKVIPEGSRFRDVMNDVLRWHRENPKDWRETWFRVQRKWSEDVGCPEGVFSPFDIDAKVNAAWILVGLLYGDGDFGRTLEISARCGDDSDCNPASAGGILGTVLGWSRIPAAWRAGLESVEREKFPYMDFSLSDLYGFSYDQALEVVRRNAGQVLPGEVVINAGPIRPVALEVNFPGLRPTEKRELDLGPGPEFSLEFEGVGIVLSGEARRSGQAEEVLRAVFAVDGKAMETLDVATEARWRRDPLFWAYGLRPGKHRLTVKLVHAAGRGGLFLRNAVIYAADTGGAEKGLKP